MSVRRRETFLEADLTQEPPRKRRVPQESTGRVGERAKRGGTRSSKRVLQERTPAAPAIEVDLTLEDDEDVQVTGMGTTASAHPEYDNPDIKMTGTFCSF